jgi:stage V sporulation protein G
MEQMQTRERRADISISILSDRVFYNRCFMQLTEVRINLCDGEANRLKAYCSLTFDDTFVIRDVKLIDGNDGLFLAMPSRKLADRCRRCGEKNHLRARFCNHCGGRLDENRHLMHHNGPGRPKLHADIAHPISVECRNHIEQQVLAAYHRELELSHQPGYVRQAIDGEETEFYHAAVHQMAGSPSPGPAMA